MGNILTACSSKKSCDKVDDFINVSVHGNVKVVVKAEEKVDENTNVSVEECIEENANVSVEECIEENAYWKEVDTISATTTTTTTTATIEQNKL